MDTFERIKEKFDDTKEYIKDCLDHMEVVEAIPSEKEKSQISSQFLYEIGLPFKKEEMKSLMSGVSFGYGLINDIQDFMNNELKKIKQASKIMAEYIIDDESQWESFEDHLQEGNDAKDHILFTAHDILGHHQDFTQLIIWYSNVAKGLQQNLSKEAPEWELVHPKTKISVAHQVAKSEQLPKNFDQWELADNDGWTVAHEAAKYGHLPADFNRWELTDNTGWTVAHAAVRYGHLPKDFDQWELADNDGWTVAHEAAKYGHLPADFDQWELANNKGKTVLDIAEGRGYVSSKDAAKIRKSWIEKPKVKMEM